VVPFEAAMAPVPLVVVALVLVPLLAMTGVSVPLALRFLKRKMSPTMRAINRSAPSRYQIHDGQPAFFAFLFDSVVFTAFGGACWVTISSLSSTLGWKVCSYRTYYLIGWEVMVWISVGWA